MVVLSTTPLSAGFESKSNPSIGSSCSQPTKDHADNMTVINKLVLVTLDINDVIPLFNNPISMIYDDT